jgi:PadR family transcriptional regulator PadR
MRIERELMRGAGPLAVLKLLGRGEMYGYQLVEDLARQSDGVLAMGQSTLYPMLYNLQAKGMIAARIDRTAAARPRKYYRLTGKGKRKLASDIAQWQAMVGAMESLGVTVRQPA